MNRSRKKPTLKTIAEKLNVSISTVSKALKNSPEISESKKEIILQYAGEIGYKPDRKALSLRSNKTMNLGIVVPEIAHYFFARVISGMEMYASQHGYQLVIAISDDKLQKEKQIIEQLSSGIVDGLIVSVAKETFVKEDYSHFNSLINNNFPIVLYDRAPNSIKADKVLADDIYGGYKATAHLIEKNCSRIGFITTDSPLEVSCKRETGYKNALKDADLTFQENYILRVNESKDIKEQINKWIKENKDMDGIFAVNEFFASIALRKALKNGISVPEKLKIIGFTDGLISKSTIPSLSTIAQHGFKIGQESAKLLIARINGSDFPPVVKIIETDLIIRETTV